jgi:hypothetical protein
LANVGCGRPLQESILDVFTSTTYVKPYGTQEDAQQRLDEAMRMEQVAWLSISLVGVQRLLLEAVAFGRLLWDVEQTFSIEYHLV